MAGSKTAERRKRVSEWQKTGTKVVPAKGGPTTSERQAARRNTAAKRKKRKNLEELGPPSGPSSVKKVTVYSNKDAGNTVSLAGGMRLLTYYESLLSNTIRVNYTYVDSGDTANNQKKGSKCKNTTTAVDGLPIVGEEKVEVELMDNRANTLSLVLYINEVNLLEDEATDSVSMLDLVSKEFIVNETGPSRVDVCMEGKISEHIEKILKENLKTEKELDIEETGAKNYNFIGNKKKPFWCMNNLSTKAAPKKNKAGNTAGFILYETADGYHFKSLDTLLGQKKKKAYIYTESTKGSTIPAGYDGKALSYEKDSSINVQGKYMMGAYSTRCISFNPFNCEYNESIFSADTSQGGPASDSPGNQENLTLAGKSFWQSNKEFDSDMINKSFTRTTWNVEDTGTLPGGKTQEQIDKSKEENFQLENIFNQSIMRYNQLFGMTTTITIAGDFSLHAGEAVFIDAPKLEAGKEYENWNEEAGGVYIIADICHYISPKETYTKMNLVRDSTGRKGNHSSKTATGQDIVQNKSTDRYRIDPGSM